MQFTTTLLAALLSATTALAAPAAADVSMMAATQQWTITNMKRVCASGTCTWTFGIDTHTAATTPCTFQVKGAPASEASSVGNVCGPFTVSTGWSGQFGAGKGFTTLSVVENSKKLIIYPAYTDTQLNTGKVVTPNQSYTPQNLPA